MLSSIVMRRGENFPHNPPSRGYCVVYRPDEANFCPGCGRAQWLIGRLLAECAVCGTAVPLAEARMHGSSGGHSRNRRPGPPIELAA